MTDMRRKPRFDLTRRSVALERAASLVERGRELAATLSGDAFASVDAGKHHTLALKRDSSLWAWGGNVKSELGLAGPAPRDRPARVGEDGDWASLAAGDGYSLALKRDGSLWAWGGNILGRFGLGDPKQLYRPRRVGEDGDWASVAASAHFLALKRDGSLWAWGKNAHGQLGLGDTAKRYGHARVAPERLD